MERNALKELEDWVGNKPAPPGGGKGRYCSDLSIDNGYGATCWSLTLGNSNVDAGKDWHKDSDWAKKYDRAEIYASEVSFFEYEDALPPNVIFVDNGDDADLDGWPGLEKTILAAIDKATELGL